LSLLNTTPVILPFGDGFVSHLPTILFFGKKARRQMEMTVRNVLFILLIIKMIKSISPIIGEGKNRITVGGGE